MAVEAIYRGHGSQGYMVNVRSTKRTGNIGDAGVIRFFDTKDEAEAYIDKVNSTGQMDTFVRQEDQKEKTVMDMNMDTTSFNGSPINKLSAEVPQISWLRTVFSRLTKEQINAINETGQLPKNVKFVKDPVGNYSITYNYAGITEGTRTLPAGYEVRQDVLGFTRVVPKDTEGLFIRNK